MSNARPNIPVFPQDMPFEKNEDGELDWSREWRLFWQQMLQFMQQSLSNEGLVIPSQSASNITIIQNGRLRDGSQAALPGTLLFNTSAVNGGSSSAPNGQAYILLLDGTFHPITNS